MPRWCPDVSCDMNPGAFRFVPQESTTCPLTMAAVELLQVHPRATIPYIPDLISESSNDVAAAVEAFGEILPSDRTLLVPMLGALADMPLTRAHEAVRYCVVREVLLWHVPLSSL